VITLADITEPKIDQTGPRPTGEFVYIDISSVDNESKLIVEPKRLPVDAAPSRARQRLRSGDVLVSMTRPYLNAVALVPHELDGAIGSTGFHVLRARSDVLPQWLFYGVQSRQFVGAMSELVQGALYPAVRPKDIRAFGLPLPKLDEQRRIVAEVEKQFSRLDEAVANLKRVKANLKRSRASILKVAVEESLFDNRTGSEWKRATIGEVAQVISGLTKNPKRADLPRKLPYLRVANVYANELRLDDVAEIGVADREVEKLLLKRGDLLIVEGNGSPDQIGRVAVWDDSIPNCVHQNHLIKVRCGPDVSPKWALTWLLSPGGRHQIERVSSSTSGLNTLSTGKIGRLPIPVPPLAEQRRIVAEVDRRLSIVREVEAEVDANLKRAQALRHAVLARAFSIESSRQATA
jgi:type I restriction enzyme S subunit